MHWHLADLFRAELMYHYCDVMHKIKLKKNITKVFVHLLLADIIHQIHLGSQKILVYLTFPAFMSKLWTKIRKIKVCPLPKKSPNFEGSIKNLSCFPIFHLPAYSYAHTPTYNIPVYWFCVQFLKMLLLKISLYLAASVYFTSSESRSTKIISYYFWSHSDSQKIVHHKVQMCFIDISVC